MADLISALSVFLVFLTFLLNSLEADLKELLKKRKPDANQINSLNQYKLEFKKLFYLKSLPISIVYISTFYILLPKTINIINNSKLSFWEFDEFNTLFVFIELGLLCLMIYAFIKSFQLFKKIKKF
jgi:hypothetical protein